jgi:hypothetical protein
MADFQAELENVTAQANYPEDTDKETAKRALRGHTLHYETARLAYAEAQRRHSKDSLLRFLEIACGGISFGGGCSLMQAPAFQKFEPGKIVSGQYKEGKWVTYAKVSRLESLEDEFHVVLVSALRDIK